MIFDDVESKKDGQELYFSNGARVSIEVKNGNVKITDFQKPSTKKSA